MTDPGLELVVGTYADRGGRGLYPLRFDPVKDRWTLGEPVEAIRNASFGVHAPRAGRAYFVDERDDGSVAGAAGAGYRMLGTAKTAGDAPCHLAMHPSERWLAAANYQSGSVAVLALDPATGAPIGTSALHRLVGGGPHPHRQRGPHAHWLGFDAAGTTLHCVDLGSDRILAFPFDATHGTLGEAVVAYAAPPGSGPRHLAFHPHRPLAFLISELAATLTVLHREGPMRLTAATIVPSLPGGAKPGNAGGGIVLDRAGGRVYVTNRGDDSVVVFAIAGDGTPAAIGRVATGASPRFPLLLEDHRRLLVANEQGDSVSVFVVGDEGTLTPSTTIAVPGAAFLALAHPGTSA